MTRAFQSSFQGGDDDGCVTKLKLKGSALVYSTYLGGSGTDRAGSVRVDRFGEAHVPGTTGSSDFPVTRDAFQPAYGGGPTDAFVVTLDRHGSRLEFSSFLGGNARTAARARARGWTARATSTSPASPARRTSR